MPIVKPFEAIRYNPDKIKDLASVIAPPYDVISKTMQEELYRSHPKNIVRLILGKTEDQDNDQNNRYTRSGRLFENWLGDKILVGDKGPAVYIYSQRYVYSGRAIERIGFIALMGLGLDKDNKVLPHENTLSAPKEDRLKLMKEVRANLSPIFVLYDDLKHQLVNAFKKFCRSNKPVIDLRFEKVRNRVWRVTDKKVITFIERFMEGKDIFIADGHHRYETARNYARSAAALDLPASVKENAKYIMVHFVESDEKMLTILPAHRLVKDIGGLSTKDVLAKLEIFFSIKKVPGLKALMAAMAKNRASYAFGMYLGGGDFLLLVLKDPRKSDAAIKDKPRDWKRLDVSILHMFIIQHILGASDGDDNVEFVKEPAETVRLFNSGGYAAAFFLNPTEAAQVKRIAKLGERMPRKATYFYPKPVSGLAIHRF